MSQNRHGPHIDLTGIVIGIEIGIGNTVADDIR